MVEPTSHRIPARTSGRLRRIPSLLVLTLWAVLGACGESSPTDSEPPPEARELAVVVNSIEVTLTLFDVEDPTGSLRTVELGVPDATPVGASARAGRALVPMGVVPTASVVDLTTGVVTRTLALPDTSGATGSIFLTDSTALVANPLRGTVSPVNVLSGVVGPEVPAGGYPLAFVRVGDRIAVLNAELEDFVPARTGTLTVLADGTLEELGRIELSGENPGAAVLGSDGLVYVLNGGRWGAETGSLSVVDLDLMQEVAHHPGFGDLPGAIVQSSEGHFVVSSWSFGVAVWDPASAAFLRSPQDPVAPGGMPSSAGVAVDGEGKLYSLLPECQGAATVLRLGPGYQVEEEIPVGVCPAGLTFTLMEPE